MVLWLIKHFSLGLVQLLVTQIMVNFLRELELQRISLQQIKLKLIHGKETSSVYKDRKHQILFQKWKLKFVLKTMFNVVLVFALKDLQIKISTVQ